MKGSALATLDRVESKVNDFTSKLAEYRLEDH